ncbi:glycosyltransferase family 2 protein [Desulfobacula sp.]|uniref:glycosyltransferase family 2 protein n=1 Tax=Desulfobacula sp. TaxID=2593537 RepID=UPI0025C6890D|nr:glycosyltransferase family 2 protein [Desulfobacula sp.]
MSQTKDRSKGNAKNKMEKTYTLSVIIITKNEEDRIETCLKSVAGIADEIIVFDSGSTDKTVEIIKKYTEQVFITDWPGFGPQKQRVLEKASGSWVLSIDADEALSPELIEEIPRVLEKNPREVMFRLPWAQIMFGKRLDYGRSARSIRRLFKREGARFSNAMVHETVITEKGETSTLKGRLIHYSIRDFEHLLHKNRSYSWLGSLQNFKKGKTGGGLWGASFRSVWVFFQIYIIRRGFLDGPVGFLIAAMFSQYSFNKYAGLWTLNREKRLNPGITDKTDDFQ